MYRVKEQKRIRSLKEGVNYVNYELCVPSCTSASINDFEKNI